MTAEIHRLPVRPRPHLADRHPLDRGTNSLCKIMADIRAQELRDADYRRMFEADPPFDFVDPLPRAEPAPMVKWVSDAEPSPQQNFWFVVMICLATVGAATIGVTIGRWAMEVALGWGVW